MKLINIPLIIIMMILFNLTSIYDSEAQILFTNVQKQIGSTFDINPNTATWGDVDNDGDLDVYVCNGDTNGLSLNDLNQSGQFILADESIMPVADVGSPRSVIMGDIENDGDLDMLCVRQQGRIYLFINQLVETGLLSFVDIADSVGMSHPDERYYSATMADYNNDSLLDIMITGLSSVTYTPTLLFKNTGVVDNEITFQEVSDEAGILSLFGIEMMGSVWGDYDNDGDQDVLIPTHPTISSFFYSNNGDGTFTDVTVESGLINSLGSSRASDFIDYDNDGDLDLYITRVTYAEQPDMDWCQLLRNDGGIFHEVPTARVVRRSIRGMAWGDFDNDGDPDLHLLEEGGKDILFRNDGNDTFVDIADKVGLTKTIIDGWPAEIADRGGETWADWDADGDLDLFLPGNVVPYLMRNDGGNSNNWLEIKLTGVQSNRSAAGARVIAVSQDLKQMREVHIGSGYLTGPPLDVHLGFGKRTKVDSLIIRWPSGIIDVMVNVNVNQILTINEGSTSTGVEQRTTTLPQSLTLYQNYPNPFNPTTSIHYYVSEPVRVKIAVYDIMGREVAILVDGFQEQGYFNACWDGRNMRGDRVTSGIYLYELKAGDCSETKKMIYIR